MEGEGCDVVGGTIPTLVCRD